MRALSLLATLVAGTAFAQGSNLPASITEAPVPEGLRSAVVSIRSSATPVLAPGTDPQIEEFFRRFAPRPRYFGTGLIASADGDILTSTDYAESERDKLLAHLTDGRELPLRFVARDTRTSLTLLKVDAKLAAPPLAKAGEVAVGDKVLAIAMRPGKNEPIGSAGTVRVLDIPANAASLASFIETDVGNIDGPIFNGRGEVIAFNLYVRREDQKRAFALPIATVMWVHGQLREHGRVIRGRLGIVVDQVGEMTALAQGGEGALASALLEGVLVRSVEKDGPAAKAGLRAGDVLIEIGGKPVRKPLDAMAIISASRPGSLLALKVRRQDGSQELQATVGELNEPARAFQTPTKPKPAPELTLPQ